MLKDRTDAILVPDDGVKISVIGCSPRIYIISYKRSRILLSKREGSPLKYVYSSNPPREGSQREYSFLPRKGQSM